MTTSKLDDKLDDKLEDKRSIKFTDYAINKYQANFENVKSKSVGIKLENSGLKGLKLYQYKKYIYLKTIKWNKLNSKYF